MLWVSRSFHVYNCVMNKKLANSSGRLSVFKIYGVVIILFENNAFKFIKPFC